MNRAQYELLIHAADGQDEVNAVAFAELERLLAEEGEEQGEEAIADVITLCVGISNNYFAIYDGWKRIADAHKLRLARLRSFRLGDEQAAKLAQKAALRRFRALERKRKSANPRGHKCADESCTRAAHFKTETGYWCKRHVPGSERPTGKIT